MTLGQITEILDKAQIRYHRKLSHIYGSEYWTIGGLGYRLSDHPKSEWRQSENIEITLFNNDYQPLYDQLIYRKDIDLKDKTEYEKEYIELAKKTIFPREKDGLLVTPTGALYANDEQGLINATKGMWMQKIYFPIKNKGLNNYVKKEALKKELDNAYENGTREEIDAIKKQLSENEEDNENNIEMFSKGGYVFPQQGVIKNSKNFKLEYKKQGNNYVFDIYEPIKTCVGGYDKITHKCKTDSPENLNYNNFINYLYKEKYLDNKKYKILKMELGGTIVAEPKNAKPGFRPEFLDTPIIYGRDIEISMPNGEKRKSRFAIVDAGNILASHNENNFSTTVGYPTINGENINDRNYKDDKNAQAKVIEVAQNLDPNILVSSSRTPSGTPIITQDGIVVSGNNRTMSMKLAIEQFPEQYQEYKKFLASEAFVFGFNNSTVSAILTGESIVDERKRGETFRDNQYIKIKNPILVRIDYDFPAYNTTELSKYNKETKKSERPIDKAVKIGKILSENEGCKNIVSEIVGGYETFSQFYSNSSDQLKLRDALIDCNIISKNDLAQYFDERGFNESGKDLIENILAGLVLSKDALIAGSMAGGRQFKAIVITSLPVLAKNDSLNEFALIELLNNAFLLEKKIHDSGLDFKDYIVQGNIFDDKPERDVLIMNRLLAEGRNKFKSSIEAYNQSAIDNANESLFGDKPTKQEMFDTHITKKINPTTMAWIDKATKEQPKMEAAIKKIEILEPNTPSEFDEAIMAKLEPHDDWKGNLIKEREVYYQIRNQLQGGSPIEITNEAKRIFNLYADKFKGKESVYDFTPMQEVPTKQSTNLLTSDNWFKLHPDNILGEPYQASGRFGQVTKYKGKIDAVNRIDAPLNFMQINEAENPTVSAENESIQQLLIDPQAQQNIETALSGTKNESAIRNIKRHSKAITRVVASNAVTDPDIVTFQEVFKANNPEISQDELKVFIWYKAQIRQPLSFKWYQLASDGQTPFNINDAPVKEWVKNGLLYHFRSELIPAYLYISGNIWEKKSALEHDKANIIELYGQQVFDYQKLALENVFKISYDKRLTLTNANFDNRLKLLPISKFANTFMINSLVDEKEFKMKAAPASHKHAGRPDFLFVGHISDYKKKVFTELSLTEAFQYWLVEYTKEYEIKKDTSYSEIIKIYINQASRPGMMEDASISEKKEAEAVWQRKVNITKEEGDRLFSIFLSEWLSNTNIVAIETTWNEKYNGYLPVNYNKIPVAFAHAKEYRNSVVDIRPEKREAIAFLMNEGSGCLAYDVGVGKTWSALFAIKQFLDAGYCSRPFIVVPNQVYKQFLSEGKGLFPDVKFNDLYNLSKDYIEELKNAEGKIEAVAEHSISVMTYEGFETIGFNEQTANDILFEMSNILDQDPDAPIVFSKKAAKKEAAMYERLKSLVGRGLKGTKLDIEDLGFDFACYDEAHKMKKLFVGVKGEMKKDGENREKSPYQIQAGGAPSSIALKGFMISQYILKNNNNRNILTLTATPFTNSPLEVFSVLTFIAYSKLKETGLNNLKSFFDTYVHATNELTINAKLRPERKQVVLGFNNLQSLQQLVARFINYKTGEMVKVKRPNKYVIPYKSKMVDNELIILSPEERIDSILPMSAQQAPMMADIKAYAEGKVSLNAICSGNAFSDKTNIDATDDEAMVDATEGIELDEDSLDEKEKAGVRTLRAMSHARNLALSPYLYECSGLGKPTYKQYVETSPKLTYVIESIRSVKEYHEKAGTPVSGQVIYMDRGIEYFELIRQYLINEVGYKPHEVGIIKSQMPGGKDAKEKVKMAFLGEAYDEKTGELIDIPDSERMKILIGSSTIQEGINLQKHSTVLYNCWPEWNPTSVKQLEGRIYRQGNLFNSVRIVNPLMQDSMDIFIFQKLEEKTARIAEIWDTNGESNTFNLQEFNPSEIKAALISDPYVLAEMQLMEDREKIDDDIRGVKNEISTVDKITEAAQTYADNIVRFTEWVEEYRPSKGKEQRSFSTLLTLSNDVIKTQLDAEGKLMEYSYNRKYNNDKGVVYSDKYPVSKQYYQDTLVLANRTLLKAEKDFLKPKGLTVKGLPDYKKSLEAKIIQLEEIKQSTTSEKSIQLRAEYIRADREANKIESVSVSERIKEFGRLNYLLDDKIIKGKKAEPIAMSCPPVDENGKLRIDKEAIEHLMICIDAQPQTKQLHTDSEGIYTDARKKLHKKIREKFTQDVTCIKQEKPIAILTGGAPGSGKSHFLKNYAPYLLGKDIFHIDADEVRAQLPEYKGWNASSTHFETKDIVDELISDIGGICKFDTVYDGTMNKAKKYYELINKLKAVGYDVFIIYIDVPQEVSEKRVLDRYQRTGRFVPMDIVQEVFDAGHEAFNQIKTMVEGWILVDGMTGQVTDSGGNKIPQDRNYAKLTETPNFIEAQKTTDENKAKKIKLLKLKEKERMRRIRILAINQLKQVA